MSSARPIVTRYAPSPTGALHIGGARTALYNWAFARRHQGRFLLRFEDTDEARSTRESEEEVLAALDWLGLDWDPVPGFRGIPRQSERLPRHQEALQQLLASGHAYRCTCTPEDVEAMRERARAEGRKPGYDGRCRERGHGPDTPAPWCVRLRIPAHGPTRWNDLIGGASGEDVEELDDFVLARSDGTPIYHFAVVIDDHDMGVTHVLRGREHMTSTPRQLLIYAGLGYAPPEFGHVPLLVAPTGKKLSKREAAVSVQSYRERGFLPQAVLNFIARLGWGHGDLEILTKDELVAIFALEDVGRSPSQVHDDKLFWLNQHYIKALPLEQLLPHLRPFLEREAGHAIELDSGLARLVELLRERSKTLEEMAALARFYLRAEVEIDRKAAKRFLRPQVEKPLAELRDALAALAPADWSEATLRGAFEAVLARHGLELGALAQPVRVAVTGLAISPGIFETLALLGRERSLARIDAALARVRGESALADAGED